MKPTNSFWAIAVILSIAFRVDSEVLGAQNLRDHVPAVVAKLNLQPSGNLPPAMRLNLAIELPLSNRETLTNLLREIYDPANSNYHRFLTPQQFAERFGPTEKDYQKLISFVHSNGLTVKGMHPNRTMLEVGGSVADIERVFHVNMRVYRHPTENRTFFAPSAEPLIDLELPVLHIVGLDNYIVPHPLNLKIKAFDKTPFLPDAGSGQSGTFLAKDLRAAYTAGVSLTGSGQAIGLLEFDGYYANDVLEYARSNELANVSVTNVWVGGFTGTPGSSGDPSGSSEVALDIDMALAMAPESEIIVYGASNQIPNSDQLLNRMATDGLAKQLSSSWGFQAGVGTEQIFQEFAIQGQAFFQASGDNGAYSSGNFFLPPEMTLVGGTTLSTAGPGSNWVSETVWNDSGGGIATSAAIPTWQQGIDMTANGGSTVYRNCPDVAMAAENLWIVYDNGLTGGFGGTSGSAPLWAGFAALINQNAEVHGETGVGSLNQAIYAIGKGTNYASAFHDITTGDNTQNFSPTNYFAVSGYDLCTGWGTPNGSNLLNLLAIQFAPTLQFTASPTNGGKPLFVQFTSPGLDSQGHVVTNWNWDFGDGSFSTLQNPFHSYIDAGIFQPSLKATNNLGFGVPSSGPLITVYSSTIQFTASPTNGGASLSAQFTAPGLDSQGYAITSWNWDFGDGSFSKLQNPSHTYATAGVFQPSLNATNNLGFAVFGAGPAIQVYTSPAQFLFVTNAGAITIVGYTGTNGMVLVPPIITGQSVTTIGYPTFFKNLTVTNVIIPDSVHSVQDEVFYGCSNLISVDLPSGVTSIGNLEFVDCVNLTSLKIPNSVTNIGSQAFFNCVSLTNMIIPNSVTSLGGGVFYNCERMVNITIGTNVTQILGGTFSACIGLTSVTIPRSVIYIDSQAFDFCEGLVGITVDVDNPAYSTVNGVLFNKSQTALLLFPPARLGSYSIPNTVTTIEVGAFYGSKLSDIIIPNSVATIGNVAFAQCFNLVSVTIPNGVTRIGSPNVGQGVFENCFDLISVTIPNGVTSIAQRAFASCYSLTSVTIPSSVSSIGPNAFAGCYHLQGVDFRGNAPSADSTVFSGAGGTIDYLPGTSGWGATFGGLPTALWTLPYPVILDGSTSLGATNTKFSFTVSWATNLSTIIETCTNLATPVWIPVATNSLSNGIVYFSDPEWTNYSTRYYRIRSR